MLDIFPSCNIVQYQGNVMMQPWENDKNPNFGTSLGPLKFFSLVLPLLIVRQCSKLSSNVISRETNGPNFKKMTKLILDLILAPLAQIWTPIFFSWILPLLNVRHCCKLSLYAISRKTNHSDLQCISPSLQYWPHSFLPSPPPKF